MIAKQPPVELLIRLEYHRKMFDDKDDARANRNRCIGLDVQPFHLLQHHWERDSGFETREESARAKVDTVPKGEIYTDMMTFRKVVG